MEPETRYTVIGAVVLALIGAAIVGFLWLSSSGRDSDFRYYTVYFEKQSLDGLQVGGNVNMRGITVGRVESYSLGSTEINRVNVTVRVTRDTPVRESTKASVSRNVITGIARINLVTPGTPSPELVAVAAGERYPVIAEGTSNLDQIADSVTQLSAEATKALDNVNVLLAPGNQKLVTELLASIRDLSNNLNSRVGHLDKAIKAVDDSAVAFQQSARGITLSAQRAADSLAPLSQDASDTLREARTALREFTKNVHTLESELTAAVQRFEKSSTGLVRDADDALDTGVHELRATASELRDTARIVSRTLDRLQDPRAAVLGPSTGQLAPGEVRP
jgi:phospholipid/cholesterol/gamma-HCH transport system substrate-binding protein